MLKLSLHAAFVHLLQQAPERAALARCAKKSSAEQAFDQLSGSSATSQELPTDPPASKRHATAQAPHSAKQIAVRHNSAAAMRCEDSAVELSAAPVVTPPAATSSQGTDKARDTAQSAPDAIVQASNDADDKAQQRWRLMLGCQHAYTRKHTNAVHLHSDDARAEPEKVAPGNDVHMFTSTMERAVVFAQLPALRSIVAIDLSGHELPDHDVVTFTQAATCSGSCRHLSHLNLNGSSYGALGAQALVTALPQWPDLQDLRLARNGLCVDQCSGVPEVFAQAFESLTQLTKLDLRGRTQAREFAQVMPQLSRLRWLGMAAANAWVAFAPHTALQTLVLEDSEGTWCEKVCLLLRVCYRPMTTFPALSTDIHVAADTLHLAAIHSGGAGKGFASAQRDLRR